MIENCTVDVNNKVVLVTGVSSGIGQQIAYKFASNGWVVYGTLRNIVNQKETFLKEALANNVDVSKLHVIQMNVDSLEAPSQIQEIIKKRRPYRYSS